MCVCVCVCVCVCARVRVRVRVRVCVFVLDTPRREAAEKALAAEELRLTAWEREAAFFRYVNKLEVMLPLMFVLLPYHVVLAAAAAAASVTWWAPRAVMRAAGALCVADEVQVGFGRAGVAMW